MQPLIPAIISLLLSAVFTGIDTAFISANKLRIEVDKNRNLFSATIISRFIKNPSVFSTTIWLCNIVTMVLFAVFADKAFKQTPGFAENQSSQLFPAIIEIVLISLILIVFAQLIPRLVFRLNANALLRFFSLPLYIIYLILYPVVMLFLLTGKLILKIIFRINLQTEEFGLTQLNLDTLLNETSIEPAKESEDYQELQMFVNARDLSNLKVREFMIPRNEIVAIDKTENTQSLAELITESGHSKIIVYDQSIDNVTGYVHSYDLFGKPSSIQDIVKAVIFIPGTMAADRLLNKFIVERRSVALVVDEFGGTAGMLTIEDILEEIFGDIEDEYDVEEEEDKQISDNEYLVSGRLEIDYLNEKYNLGLPESDDYQTLAGYIIHFHESIPLSNEEISINNLSFIITKATDTRIEKVLIRVNQL